MAFPRQCGRFHIVMGTVGGVVGVISFPGCVLGAPSSRRGGVLVVLSQSALIRQSTIYKSPATLCVRSRGMLLCWFGGARMLTSKSPFYCRGGKHTFYFIQGV